MAASLTHPCEVGAVGAAVQGGHEDVVIGRRDVRRISDQRPARQIPRALEEAAIVHLDAVPGEVTMIQRCLAYVCTRQGVTG